MAKRKLGRRTGGPPEGVQWIWHTAELLQSPAWLHRSAGCRRLLDFLELEHLKHGGVENGSLVAPYTELVRFGLGRRHIAKSIRDAEQRGLIKVERGGKKGTTMTELNRYTLTYQWTRTKPNGLWDWKEPTDNWKVYQVPFQRKSIKKFAKGSLQEPATVSSSAPGPVHFSELPPLQSIEINKGGVVPQSEPPSISGGGVTSSPFLKSVEQ